MSIIEILGELVDGKITILQANEEIINIIENLKDDCICDYSDIKFCHNRQAGNGTCKHCI